MEDKKDTTGKTAEKAALSEDAPKDAPKEEAAAEVANPEDAPLEENMPLDDFADPGAAMSQDQTPTTLEAKD